MKEISNYRISQKTMALEEMNHPDFNVKIYDLNGIYSSRQTVKQLLDSACQIRCCDYQGRINAVRNAFPYPKRTPLVICPIEMLSAFPTTSPANYDCKWIFPHHIEDYITEKETTYVLFKNGLKMELNCSYRTFQSQRERAANCLLYFSTPRNMQMLLWREREVGKS